MATETAHRRVIYQNQLCTDGALLPCTRALRDGHFDFGRDRDGISRDGIFSRFSRSYLGLQNMVFSFDFVAFIHYDV
jgi:hypothetical protein